MVQPGRAGAAVTAGGGRPGQRRRLRTSAGIRETCGEVAADPAFRRRGIIAVIILRMNLGNCGI
jgi:hypothetical protein